MPLEALLVAILLVLATGAMSRALWVSAQRLPLQIGRRQAIWARALPLAPLGWCLIEIAARLHATWIAGPGKVLVMLAFSEFLRALLAFHGQAVRPALALAPAAFVAAVSSAWIVALPDQPLRIGLLSLLCCAAAAGCAFLAARPVSGRRSAHAVMVTTVFAFSSMLFLVRGLPTLLTGAPDSNEALATPLAYSLLFGGALLAPCAATLGFVQMESERLFDRLRREGRLDDLTGACTRQGFVELADEVQRRARRATSPGAVLVLDAAATAAEARDERAALLDIADALHDVLRAGDRVGRVDRAEFAIWLPQAGEARARRIAGRVAAAVAALATTGNHADARAVAVGIAVARGGDTVPDLITRAGQSLSTAVRPSRANAHAFGAAAGMGSVESRS